MLIIYGHIPATFRVNKMVSGFLKCDINYDQVEEVWQQLFYWVDTVISSLLPAFLICITGTMILTTIVRQGKELQSMEVSDTHKFGYHTMEIKI